MTELVTLSLHQRDATLDERERLVERLEGFTDPAAIGLLTCHRVEIVAALEPEAEPRTWLAERLGGSPAGLSSLRVRRGRTAARHLFGVACGLDSAIVGERQILGQLRRAYDGAREHGGLDPLLAAALQHALHLGRTLRIESALGSASRSVGSLAVEDALAAVSDPATATVLVIGAGEVGSLATRAFATRVRTLIVANRDLEKGRRLAERHGGRAIGLTDVPSALAVADAVISAADTRGRLLTADLLGARLARGPLVLVDIAVPRSVDAAARGLVGLRYRTVDDLTASSPIDARLVAAARRRCADEAVAFLREWRGRKAAPAIRALRERGEELRRRQVGRALRKLGHLSERDRRVVDALSRSLVGALLHGPTVAARATPERAGTLRDIFTPTR